MSNRYKGAVISATPPTTTGGNDGVASGAWTLEQQMQAQAAGLWPNQPIFYIEDVFSTYLYTGDGGTQTITNGINLSGKGGLVWVKCRSAITSHVLTDSANGAPNSLNSDSTAALASTPSRISALNSNGFSVGSSGATNTSAATYCSWTFRKQPKFFDVITWTGTGATQHNVSHNLGAVPGFVIVKDITITSQWSVAARKNDGTYCGLRLNSTLAASPASTTASSAGLFSTHIDFGNTGYSGVISSVNVIGSTYVAYIFAHDAGGFGLTGTDNVISCGSFTTNGSGNVSQVSLGYEPQWVLYKTTDVADNWRLVDSMRGMPVTAPTGEPVLKPNLSDAEQADAGVVVPNATGFSINGASPSFTYIYIAIRRGPMRVPTSGTSVFNTKLRTGTSTATTISGVGFPTDLVFSKTRTPSGNNPAGVDFDRLRGIKQLLTIEAAAAEYTKDPPMSAFTQDGYSFITGANDPNISGYTYADWNFGRAPGYFDTVCYTGTGSTTTITHNLGVTPELVITKSRSQALGWVVWTTSLASTDYWIRLDTTNAVITSPVGYGGTFSASNYTIANTGPFNALNNAGSTYVAYLFATCPGVSKVGTYTGTGAAQTINCGFTTGARWVMIKRTDSTGDWNVWDSARGIIPANDPYLALNSTAAEVTGTDYVDTTNVGFDITSTAPAAINANGGTFIFLAIA